MSTKVNGADFYPASSLTLTRITIHVAWWKRLLHCLGLIRIDSWPVTYRFLFTPREEIVTKQEQRRMQGCCFDCGRRYGDEYGFPDLIVSNEVWLQIAPLGDEGGLLCPSCMCRRLYLAGLSTTTARWRSGPLCSD